MLNLMKPHALKRGNRVATVSLSWGGAGEPGLSYRYERGKHVLESVFGLEVIEMPHTLASPNEVYEHPEKRAQDLMDAFSDPEIKAIFSNIGGNDSIRMLPYIDYEVIKKNPKIFIGFSDSTITHLICLKAGIGSFYGPAILTDFAETGGLMTYTKESVEQSLFSNVPVGEVKPSSHWTSERLDWFDPDCKNQPRTMYPNKFYEFLQGGQAVTGPLIGGCLDVLEIARGTSLFPEDECFDDAILFLETSEVQAPPWLIEDIFRNYAVRGILQRLNGLVFAKPKGEVHYEAYKTPILKVLKENNLESLPVLYNASFGHNEPKCVMPIGVRAQLDPINQRFSLIESGVQ
ncbi:LD-carboxypeptidase [Alkalihalobacillus sp. LMS6]|uniref:S66 family peptidase n=1 Tax=Alkalihalobacillus sp. LMS6 TaxID=2924034 RepID=UPI0020D0664F|nr:S66 peptidase family protein [Alkalihalobacillus sp. LMS6]UTR07682.1 LD-carboxypeptidase [Alkalihalobacillus sp. LMS6]